MTNADVAVRLLLVEDSAAQAMFIQQTLRELSPPFDVAWAESLADALQHIDATPVDLVLLDLVLPDSDGLATFDTLHRAHPDIPVVVLSGAGDDAIALRAVSEGAQDYLAKNTMSPELLARAIRYALERHRSLQDLQRLALSDHLTGVHNRRGFLAIAEQRLEIARRNATPITLLFVDVDGLKHVNDSHGHQNGDQALVDVAVLLQSALRGSDVIGRIGGDEFCAMLVDDDAGETGGSSAAARFQAAIDADHAVSSRPFRLSCSVGVVTRNPLDGLTVTELLSQADDDMYGHRELRRHPVTKEICTP